ncbi:MAG: hypothetical protein HUJ25_09845 [Crocinitomicaceae bacterium]|nr:hypothetical protein [Crocinitomicaceae bacterium]
MHKLFIYSIAIISLVSCREDEDKGKLLASVDEAELYQQDLQKYLNSIQYEKPDSAKIADEFIDQWIEDQILLQEAEENEQLDHEKISYKVAAFRKDIYILKLEQILVDQQLDTVISDQEIKTYYEKHKQDFQLNDYLVKVLYLKIPVDAPDIEKINRTYKLYNDTDIEEIDVYAKIYASNYYYDENNWIYFDDLLKEIPLQDINKDRFIMKKSKIRFEENGYHYFLNILDYKLKNTISPLSFEKNNIKERILNLRIKELRQKIKQDIINEAYESNSVKKY